VEIFIIDCNIFSFDSQFRPLQHIDGHYKILEDICLVVDTGILAQLLWIMKP
jgi:hypothetical protein